MSFKIKKFSAIRLFANDISKSKDWYQALFDQAPVEDQEFFVSFKIEETYFDITVPDAKNPYSPGGCVGYWFVDDIESVLKKVESLGGKLFRGPLNVNETKTVIIQIQDPFGNVIGFESPLTQS